MSQKGRLETKTIVSSVLTRSQTSRRSMERDLDKLIHVNKSGKLPAVDIVTTKKKAKSKHSQGSKINMELFGDEDLDYLDNASTSSSEITKTDVSSVSSKLHVSLDEVKEKLKSATKHKKKTSSKGSTKVDSKGSITPSELLRIKVEFT